MLGAKKGGVKKLPLVAGLLVATCVVTAFVRRLAMGNTSSVVMEASTRRTQSEEIVKKSMSLRRDQEGGGESGEGPPEEERSTTLPALSHGLLLEWQFYNGGEEVLYGDSHNSVVLKGDAAHSQWTASGLELTSRLAWAETGLLQLPNGLTTLDARSVEVMALIQDLDEVQAIVSLDGDYQDSALYPYNHVGFDAILYEASSKRFEIGHETIYESMDQFADAQTEAGVWRHLVLTYDGFGGEELFVDGVLQEFVFVGVNARPTLTANSKKLLFGIRHYGCHFLHCRLNGKIREVRLYDHMLSRAHVKALFEHAKAAADAADAADTTTPPPPAPGLRLEWKLNVGAQELRHGSVRNALVLKGNTADGQYTSEGLVLSNRDVWAQTGILELPFGQTQLNERTIEVLALINDVSETQAIVSMDSLYIGDSFYTHVAFDGIMYNEANTHQFEIGHEYNRNEGTHTGHAQTQAGVWRHLVLSQDASTEKLYVDGVETESYSVPIHTLNIIENKLLFGKRHHGCDYADCMLNGKIREVRVYNKALSAAEVLAQYNAFKGNDEAPGNGLLLEWQLDKGSTNGPKELLHGDAHNALVVKGNAANAHYTSEGLQLTAQDSWAETGLLRLPYGLSQLRERTIEVIAKVYDVNEVSAIVSLDSKYTASGGYTHVAFDGIMFNEARTKQFEIGHEYNRNEGTHTGFAETTANVWRHLVLTQGATTERLYVDGVMTEETATDNGPDLLKTIENKLLFGRRHEYCTHEDCLLRGVIKLVRVYGKALSHAQVLQL